MTEKPPPNYGPVYAAAVYPDLVPLARKHGYALAVHGSLARDFDLVAIPWTDNPGTPQDVLDEIMSDFALSVSGECAQKPQGRVAYSLAIGFGHCQIDISFMPVIERKEPQDD